MLVGCRLSGLLLLEPVNLVPQRARLDLVVCFWGLFSTWFILLQRCCYRRTPTCPRSLESIALGEHRNASTVVLRLDGCSTVDWLRSEQTSKMTHRDSPTSTVKTKPPVTTAPDTTTPAPSTSTTTTPGQATPAPTYPMLTGSNQCQSSTWATRTVVPRLR